MASTVSLISDLKPEKAISSTCLDSRDDPMTAASIVPTHTRGIFPMARAKQGRLLDCAVELACKPIPHLTTFQTKGNILGRAKKMPVIPIVFISGLAMGNGCTRRETLLLQQCRKGSAAAWTELYEEYSESVRRVIRKYSRRWSIEDVEDITQSVFMELINAFERFDGTYRLSQLICGVAERQAREEMRLRSAAKRDAPVVSIGCERECSAAPQIADSNSPPPDEILEQEQLKSLLRRAMKRLGEKCRQLLEWRDFEERSIREIAEMLGEKENTVTVWRKRCVEDLKALVHELLRQRCAG